MTTKIIEKDRYKILYDGFTWEIDVFSSSNKGLIIAEIELPDENTIFKQPEWATIDVSFDSRYNNCNLANYPYSIW
jgi:CYTH domain-containing protein